MSDGIQLIIMEDWTCDECKYECVPISAFPCCDCLEGDRYEPEESEDGE